MSNNELRLKKIEILSPDQINFNQNHDRQQDLTDDKMIGLIEDEMLGHGHTTQTSQHSIGNQENGEG